MKDKIKLEEIVGYLPYNLGLTWFNNQTLPFESQFIQKVLNMNDEIYKPLLHPISSLTKEIEVDGKLVNVSDIIFPKEDYMSEHERNVAIYSLQLQNAINHSCTYFSVIQVLYKYHFDVHGLIERGLAIAIK